MSQSTDYKLHQFHVSLAGYTANKRQSSISPENINTLVCVQEDDKKLNSCLANDSY